MLIVMWYQVIVVCVPLLATPFINATTSVVTAVEGETVQLNCTVQSTPTPTLQDSLQWYRSGKSQLSDDNDKYDFTFENGLLSLIIHNVNSSDNGTYICYVNNTHIPAAANDSVILTLTTMSRKSHDNHMTNTNCFCFDSYYANRISKVDNIFCNSWWSTLDNFSYYN